MRSVMTLTPTDPPKRRPAVGRILRFVLIAALLGLLLGNFTEGMVTRALKGALSRLTGKHYLSARIATTMDADGIPYTEYAGGGRRRNPTDIANAAESYFAKLPGDDANRQRFLNCADWLVAHATYQGGYALLEYDFPYPPFRMTPPWRSGLAHGRALTVLVHAHALTHNPRFLDAANALLRAFDIAEDDGGFAVTMGSGVWFEEYAGKGGARPRVLNGMIYALFGLHDFYDYTKGLKAEFTYSQHAWRLFQQGCLAVAAMLPRFDDHGCSYYDLLRHPAGPYHAIHIEQLDKLYDLTSEPVFKTYHDRWAAYREPSFISRLFTEHTPLQLAVLLLNILAVLLLLAVGRWLRLRFGHAAQ